MTSAPIPVDDDVANAVEPRRFLFKAAVFVSLIAVAAATIVYTEYPTRLAFQLVLAAVLAHGTELVHECIHRLATGRERVDRCIGSILAQTTCISFAQYHFLHLQHHRYVGTPHDRDSFSDAHARLHSSSRHTRIRALLRHLTMADHWKATARRVAAAAVGRLAQELISEQPTLPAAVAQRVQRDYRVIGAIALLALLSAFLGLPVVDLWLIPLLLWSPIHAAIELPEHYGCAPTTRIERNTRSIKAGPFATWQTNYNCFHVGHHLRMDLPFRHLQDFETSRQDALVHQDPSYWAFYRRVVADVFTNR